MSTPLRHVPPMHALAAFEAAARLGGFAQAAAELCVTPSAVSHRIRQLESQLGTPLFERTGTGVRPTTAGRLYLENVRETFDKPLFGVCVAAPFTYHAVASPAQAERVAVRELIAWLVETFA